LKFSANLARSSRTKARRLRLRRPNGAYDEFHLAATAKTLKQPHWPEANRFPSSPAPAHRQLRLATVAQQNLPLHDFPIEFEHLYRANSCAVEELLASALDFDEFVCNHKITFTYLEGMQRLQIA
jgi:hypothetical protein